MGIRRKVNQFPLKEILSGLILLIAMLFLALDKDQLLSDSLQTFQAENSERIATTSTANNLVVETHI